MGERALLLRLEPLPRGELAPPLLKARQQLLQKRSHPAVARGEVVGEVRARGSPAECRPERDGAVEIVHRDHAGQYEVDALPPHRRGDATDHVARNRLLENDRHPAESPQVIVRARDHRRRRLRAGNELDQRDELRRVERVRHEAAILAAAAREQLRRRDAARGARDQRLGSRHVLDGVKQPLLGDEVLVDSLHNPVGVLHRVQQAAALLQLEQPALHDPLCGAPQRHQRARAARHVGRGALQAPRAGVEDHDGPARGSA